MLAFLRAEITRPRDWFPVMVVALVVVISFSVTDVRRQAAARLAQQQRHDLLILVSKQMGAPCLGK